MSQKVVFITGASSGIGKATALLCAKQGHSVLLCARRKDRLDALVEQIQTEYKTKAHAFVLDVSNADQVKEALSSLPPEWQEIDALVNNAGNAHGLESFTESDLEDWIKMIDINVKGLLFVTQFILKGMLSRNRGHVINIGSIAGHEVYAKGTVYCASKHAVRAITDGLKKEVHGTPIRVSSVDPGLVDTEFSLVRFKQDQEKSDAVYSGANPLHAEDIADAVYYCLSRPEHVNIKEILVLPTSQSSVSMVDRT